MTASVLKLDKGDYPEHLQVVSCPNKWRSFEPLCVWILKVISVCTDVISLVKIIVIVIKGIVNDIIVHSRLKSKIRK